MQDILRDRFKIDLSRNLQLFNILSQNEEHLNSFIKRSFSHIINTHYIWLCRIEGSSPESNFWDQLPLHHGEKFLQENYLRTISYLDDHELQQKVNYHDEEGVKLDDSLGNILLHVLDHGNYHRGQISMELRKQGVTPPSMNLIPYL